jgi:hypothetical protein
VTLLSLRPTFSSWCVPVFLLSCMRKVSSSFPTMGKISQRVWQLLSQSIIYSVNLSITIHLRSICGVQTRGKCHGFVVLVVTFYEENIQYHIHSSPLNIFIVTLINLVNVMLGVAPLLYRRIIVGICETVHSIDFFYDSLERKRETKVFSRPLKIFFIP